MYRSEINERSPMRVFERSMHGGLGRGNVGVIAARPGVGKTPMLVQIGLDDLLRERKVLHLSHEHAVDHVRAYYDEIFHDLAMWKRLEDPERVRLDIERSRLIFSHLGHTKTAPPSLRGGATSVSRILETVTFAKDTAHFNPDVIIIDGFDLSGPGMHEAFKALHKVARDLSAEVWISVQTTEGPTAEGLLPTLEKVYPDVACVVYLEANRDSVSLRLLKDHDNQDLADFHLRLDPHSMRILDTDVRSASERPKDARRFRMHSGGTRGAEAEFGACAEKWGMQEVNYSFAGHKFRERTRRFVELTEEELRQGDFSLVYVSKRLGRVLSEIPLVRNILQTIWYQINAASQVFVIGAIQEDGHVRGGTGWGAELARLWKKPVFVFDQDRKAWFAWNGTKWELCVSPPSVNRENFAGIGTQNLTEDGKKAIFELFARSFGAPAA
ncbi:MAG: hypothetical protein IPK82_12405 [Polyangiaceae bacterium]|nr:hypothetical protein [Polyangiaceae bacterium]